MYLAPQQGVTRPNFVKIFDAGKTRIIELPYGEKTVTIYEAVFIWYRNVTDRRTDRFAIPISRVSMLTRDKNHPGEKRNKTANVNVKKTAVYKQVNGEWHIYLGAIIN